MSLKRLWELFVLSKTKISEFDGFKGDHMNTDTRDNERLMEEVTSETNRDTFFPLLKSGGVASRCTLKTSRSSVFVVLDENLAMKNPCSKQIPR